LANNKWGKLKAREKLLLLREKNLVVAWRWKKYGDCDNVSERTSEKACVVGNE